MKSENRLPGERQGVSPPSAIHRGELRFTTEVTECTECTEENRRGVKSIRDIIRSVSERFRETLTQRELAIPH